MFPRAITLGRIQGIPIRVDPTLLFIGLLIVWTFTERFSTDSRPVLGALAMAAVAAALFFLSILAHELGHALEARHRSMTVHGVTLFLFGGVTEMQMHASRPRDEFVVAAVGPWVSFVAAASFGLIATAAGTIDAPVAQAAAEITGLMGWLNLALAIFNLVPGAPLDGGRVLRSALWAMLGNRSRANRWAARAGQGVGVLVMLLGVLSYVQANDFVGGLWLIFIGTFIWNGARAELGAEQVRDRLAGRTAAEAARLPIARVDIDRALSFVELDIEQSPLDVALVTEDELPVGYLTGEGLQAVADFDRQIRAAGDVLQPFDGLPRMNLDTSLTGLLEALQEHPVVVLEHDGEIVTLATLESVATLLEGGRQTSEEHLPPPPPPTPPPSPAGTGERRP